MAVWEELRHQVAIAGRVTDSFSGIPLKGVCIEITSGPAAFTNWLDAQSVHTVDDSKWDEIRPDRIHTSADGHFHYMDLPDGDYDLTAIWLNAGTRYGSGNSSTTVSRDTTGAISMGMADMGLSPTRIQGRVVRAGTTNPVAMAEIRVTGSNESVLTDSNGQYIISGIEVSSSDRNVIVKAAGYADTQVSIRLDNPGMSGTLDVEIPPE